MNQLQAPPASRRLAQKIFPKCLGQRVCLQRLPPPPHGQCCTWPSPGASRGLAVTFWMKQQGPALSPTQGEPGGALGGRGRLGSQCASVPMSGEGLSQDRE